MNKEETELFKELQAQNVKYKEMLEKLLASKKSIAKVVSDCEMLDDVPHYRVEMGNEQIIAGFADEVDLFGKNPEKLPKNTEVITVNGAIIAVVPKKLEVTKERVNTHTLIDWNEIGGMKSQLGIIRNAIELPMKNEKLAKELGLKPIKGILLYGPPGCGKTLIAKAIAKTILQEKSVPADAFIYIKGAEVHAPLVGVAEATIRNMFKRARDYSKENGKRAIIFIDEAEALLPKRGSVRSSDVDRTVVPAFLAEMDGFDGNSPIVLLATNKEGQLDEAVIRDGRIDLRIEIPRPGHDDLYDLFTIHAKNFKLHAPIHEVSEAGKNMIIDNGHYEKRSGAMVANILNIAANKAMIRKVNDKNQPLGITIEDLNIAYSEATSGN